MKILIAGGGTGGHLFPAVAIAEAFRIKDPEGDILFAGTDNPLEKATLSKRGFGHVSLPVGGLKGLSLWGQIKTYLKVLMGTWQALGVIRRFKPDMVIGVGGYASGPVCLVARLVGRRMVVHEQNVLPGLTNRILGRFAHRIFISFPDSLAVFKRSKTVLTGNPVRPDLLGTEPRERTREGFTILVMGGSQGAHRINCAVVEALEHLGEPAERTFIHQTGPKDASWVKRAYEERGIRAKVAPFFEDMASAYHAADLVICRAGATTVAELAALGKAAILIPFPFAASSHQALNARFMADGGGGEVILEQDLNGALLGERINHYASSPNALKDMTIRASALNHPSAAEVIVDECRRLLLFSY
jgi:UDP-N-acetylglucosamine--N-acetylmuramyl-(pentapeptide) pyrophosphoryl-undecaprenol N-acetylglucosamine transferase